MDHIRPPPELDLTTSDGNLSERWRKWEQTMKLYLDIVMSDGEEKEKCSAFLYIIGQDGRDVFNTMKFQDAEKDKIDDLFKKFKDYCQPSENTIVWRHRFNTKFQGEGESIDQFVTELKTLAKNCKFGEICDELIRDRIVVGVNNDKIKERLLRDGGLTLKKAIDACRASEESKNMMKNLNEEAVVVGAVKKRSQVAKPTSTPMKTSHKQQNKQQFAQKDREKTFTCRRCGNVHGPRNCPAFGTECPKCQKPNHFAKCCRTTAMSRPGTGLGKYQKGKVYNVEFESDDEETLFIGAVKTSKNEDELFTTLTLKGRRVKLKVDTGSQANIISIDDIEKMRPKPVLKRTKSTLTSYTGDKLPVIGQTNIRYKQEDLIFFVTDSEVKQVPLLGLKSSRDLGIIKVVFNTEIQKKDPIQEYPKVFSGLGCLKDSYKIRIDTSVSPVVHPPRNVPATLREKLKETLDEMEQQSVIRKVDHPTDWVSSLVIVEKKGKLRICLDPKNLNMAIKREHYQLPTIEEIVSRMSKATVFSKLDARHGYWQLPLDEESQELTTFNTPFGRYCYTRTPFGIKSAQEVFQKRICQHFDDLRGVETDIDDILVWGETMEEHDKNLKKTLERCQDIGLTLNAEKCRFRMTEVTYIGHTLTAQGVQPDPSKIEAIREMPEPTDKKGVERLLGTVNYLAKFIPNMSEVTEPIRKLLRSDVEFEWSTPQETAFRRIKDILTETPVLAYYNVKKPVTVSCDASKSGLGAVLLQDNKPVAYASRALTDTETRYAQIEKELLAVVFALERFNQYTYGKIIDVESDHKPLESILKKPLNQAPPRLQRMLLRLQRYDISLRYKPGKELVIADTLSRAHLDKCENDGFDEEVSYHVNTVMNTISMSDDKLEEVRKATLRDESLQLLCQYITDGWPEHRRDTSEKVHDFWPHKHELTIVDGIILKGTCIVIPRELRSDMLTKIHIGHMGIEKSKKRARELLFWPGMSKHINDIVSNCPICLDSQNKNQKEPLNSSEIPDGPWQVVGTDLFTWNHADYVIVTDYYSRFFEIGKLENTRSATVILLLKSFFARHGIPREVRSDNGPQYSSQEFRKFAKEWDFKHITSSPHYPQGNALAEKSVQTVKRILEKSLKDGKDPYIGLLEYRNTPTDTDSPAKLLMSRETRSVLPVTLDKLKPKAVNSETVKSQRETTQDRQRRNYNIGSKPLSMLSPNEQIRFQHLNHWKPGNIVETHSDRSYIVQTPEGNKYRRNRKHIIRSGESRQERDIDPYVDIDAPDTSVPNVQPTSPSQPVTQPTSVTMTPTRSRSGRIIREPVRMKDYV
jgi:transposase InsO family protein